MIRVYLALGAAALVLAAYIRYEYVTEQNDRLRVDLRSAELIIEQSRGLLIKERQNAAQAALSAQKAYEVKQNDKIELDRLRRCVADKSCGVRIVKGACPAMPSSNSNAGGTEAADAADRRVFEQDYFNLLESIKETKMLYNWMQQENIARSHPDYCQPK